MTGIILAGGKSSRMGVNKAFLNIGETTIIDRMLSVYKKIFSEIIIVTNSPKEYEYCGAKLIEDIIPNSGPLGGIYTGLLTSNSQYSFIAACDMPFVSEDIIRYIISIQDYDIVVPVVRGLYEPLFALYSKKCLIALKQQLEAKKLSIKDVFKMCSVKELQAEQLWKSDSSLSSFTNVNTPEEFDNALRIKEVIRQPFTDYL